MANAGFSIINDNNILLINDSYMNFALSRKIQVSTLPYWFADVKSGYMVDGSNFAFRKLTLGSNETCAFIGGINGNGSIDGFIARDYYNANINDQKAYYIVLRKGVNAASLYVYTFGEYNKVGGGSERYGLQVFDESNNLVFSSNKKPLKILHYSTTNDGYRCPSGRKTAIYVDNVYIEVPISEIGDPYTPLYIDGNWGQNPSERDMLMPYMSRYFRSSAPTIVSGQVRHTSFNQEHPTYGLGNYTIDTWNGFIYTIIDVTSY